MDFEWSKTGGFANGADLLYCGFLFCFRSNDKQIFFVYLSTGNNIQGDAELGVFDPEQPGCNSVHLGSVKIGLGVVVLEVEPRILGVHSTDLKINVNCFKNTVKI